MPSTNADYHGISSGTLWTRVIRELKMQRHPLKLNAFTIPLNMELCLWANSKFEISLPATVFIFFSYTFRLPLASSALLVNMFEAVHKLHSTQLYSINHKNVVMIFYQHHADISLWLMVLIVGCFNPKYKTEISVTMIKY